jgi:sterol desaturase/sphingolipid hydroxylase (fatty acid hydroxylase superfamily)
VVSSPPSVDIYVPHAQQAGVDIYVPHSQQTGVNFWDLTWICLPGPVHRVWVQGFHYLLYVGNIVPLKLKFNPTYPKNSQHLRDFALSTSGALIDSAMQIGFMHLYATKKINFYSDFWAGPEWAQELGQWQGPTWSLAFILIGCIYQDFHFYFVHRYIHRWGWDESSFPWFDPGKFLYKVSNPGRRSITS